jgi:DNA-binding transcriptional ArsR family regulator
MSAAVVEDKIFQALADPSRRAILESLTRGETIGNISGVSAVNRRPVLRPAPTFSRSPP